MDSPVAKIIMLAATIAITAAVVLFTWSVIGANTPDLDDGLPADLTQIRNENLCEAVGGAWDATDETCS